MPRPKRVPDAAVTAEVCGLGLSGSKKKLEPMQIADTMLEVVERNERRFEIKITRCLYHELTTATGVPELTPVICQIDNAALNSYLPDRVVFTRGGPGRRISNGAKECSFIWQRYD
jgi:hypothetical protein